jgi:hypothetical protein
VRVCTWRQPKRLAQPMKFPCFAGHGGRGPWGRSSGSNCVWGCSRFWLPTPRQASAFATCAPACGSDGCDDRVNSELSASFVVSFVRRPKGQLATLSSNGHHDARGSPPPQGPLATLPSFSRHPSPKVPVAPRVAGEVDSMRIVTFGRTQNTIDIYYCKQYVTIGVKTVL